jgi:acetylornithine deacetylase/succinyl-diaminopimelate desuccinylase-like protein
MRSIRSARLEPPARAAQEVADRWFFETVVRVHRAVEGAAFTGSKPAGLDVGPVIPAAERALESGSVDGLVNVLCDAVRSEVERRHARAMALKAHADESVPDARAYVDAMLGLQVWAHTVHKQVKTEPHRHIGHEHG